jgi:hypothetical protein
LLAAAKDEMEQERERGGGASGNHGD